MRRAAALATIALLAGCGAADGAATADPGRSAADGPSGMLTVFAAASLTDVFEGFGEQLSAQHPGLTVRFNFAGSSALAQQIVQGAPADVFASADQRQMSVVVDGDRAATEPEVFASNVLWIAVPPGNPGDVRDLEDFARGELAIALCAPEVPCGRAAQAVFDAAGVTPTPDTYEEDVRAALTKVEIGEVDAALVYASDVVAAGDAVEGVEFPEAPDTVNRYPVCVLAGAPNPEAAALFVELVRSEGGQQALEDAGFRAP